MISLRDAYHMSRLTVVSQAANSYKAHAQNKTGMTTTLSYLNVLLPTNYATIPNSTPLCFRALRRKKNHLHHSCLIARFTKLNNGSNAFSSPYMLVYIFLHLLHFNCLTVNTCKNTF